MKKFFLILSILLNGVTLLAQKPAVWIITDMSDKEIPGPNKEGTLNDPDDISAMAGYLLLANEFYTKGITVASTHRPQHKHSANQAEWTVEYFGKAFDKDRFALEKAFGGYPKGLRYATDAKLLNDDYIPVYESSIKKTSERFSVEKRYDIMEYVSVKALYDEINRKDKKGDFIYSEKSPINILCWGSLTEPAILVNYCLEEGNAKLLKRIRFIAHWTNSSLHQGTLECPECVANCKEDLQACRYLKEQAFKGLFEYYELGAIGQHGIVSGSPSGPEFYNRFNKCNLGSIFASGKYAFDKVDDSDCATYYVLLGKWGLMLENVPANGSNTRELELKNEEIMKNSASEIRLELLKRCDLVSNIVN